MVVSEASGSSGGSGYMFGGIFLGAVLAVLGFIGWRQWNRRNAMKGGYGGYSYTVSFFLNSLFIRFSRMIARLLFNLR